MKRPIRIVIELPEELRREIKASAAVNGMTMKDFLLLAARNQIVTSSGAAFAPETPQTTD